MSILTKRQKHIIRQHRLVRKIKYHVKMFIYNVPVLVWIYAVGLLLWYMTN